MSPFSGISLVMHLAIIGVGKIAGIFRKPARTVAPQSEIAVRTSWLLVGINRTASVLIVLAVFTVMLASFARAVRTGIREGAKEPQVQYVRGRITALKQADWSSLLPFANQDNQEARTETEPVHTTPVPAVSSTVRGK